MSGLSAIEKIEALSAFFKTSVDATRRHVTNCKPEMIDWVVSMRGVNVVFESKSTIRYQDGRVERMIATSSPLSLNKSFEDAVDSVWNRTLGHRKGFLVSDQDFHDEDCHKPTITVYHGRLAVDIFPYEGNKDRVRDWLKKLSNQP